jgi:hypothetical protein
MKTTTINYNLPIPIALFDFNKTLLLEYSLPSFIKYSSSGLNPTFIDKNLIFCYNNISWNIESISPNLCDVYSLPLQDENGNFIYDAEGNIVYD